MSHFIDELRWRGMLHDQMPGTEELLTRPHVKGYIGFDPTADSLGVGNMVQIMTLMHFQRAGHKPIALIGGATGMVGDPSGKSQERNLLDMDQLLYNQDCQKTQLEKFLDFDCGPQSAEIVNNYDWFKDFGYLQFIREVGKHITVNYMLSKDSVKNRLENGMSFTEFSYQLIQGYDFYHLWKNHGVMLQMGGSDQWGNITTGTELIRRMAQGNAFALTTPLIKKADGTKFGKSEGGNIWLDPKKTSPYKFYQFWLNAADEDAGGFLRIFSLKSREEIETVEIEHLKGPHLRLLQRSLAEELCERVHSKNDLEKAIQASEMLFGKGDENQLRSLDNETLLEVFEGVPQFVVSKSILEQNVGIVEVLSVETQVFSSKGEARKMLDANGVSVNKQKVDAQFKFNTSHLINGKFILVQKGKKQYYLLIFG